MVPFTEIIGVWLIIAGWLQVHCSPAPAILLSCSSLCGHGVSVFATSSGHFVIGGNANTRQFPPISLNGFGILIPRLYGQKHIAIPNHRVSVGATYNLNCDVVHQKIPPALIGDGGRIVGTMEFVGNAKTGIPFPKV